MKKTLFILMLLNLSCKSIISQEIPKSIKNEISQLSWNSFSVVMNYSTRIELSDGMKRIIQNGKESTHELILALYDNEKTVSAHLILTQLWDPVVFEINACQQFEMDAETYTTYIVNNLTWLHNFKNKDNSIDDVEKNKIISYWNNRVN